MKYGKVGRNQSCPCGSKKKYKHCCWEKDVQSSTSNRNMYLLGGLFVVALVAVLVIISNDSSNTTFQSGAPGLTPGPAPGPAPLGKVWSPEHGHWHDAVETGSVIPTDSLQTTGSTNQQTPLPDILLPQTPPQSNVQRPDSTPPGKVWSPEHGHWHDALVSDSL